MAESVSKKGGEEEMSDTNSQPSEQSEKDPVLKFWRDMDKKEENKKEQDEDVTEKKDEKT